MKKIALLSVVLFLVAIGCTSKVYFAGQRYVSKDEKQEIEKDVREAEAIEKRLADIRQSMMTRGYLTTDELEEISDFRNQMPWIIKSVRMSRGYPLKYGSTPEVLKIYATAIGKDYLPFRAMFYLALEKENYEEAELIIAKWNEHLSKTLIYLRDYFYPVDKRTNEIISVRDFALKQGIKSYYYYYPYKQSDRDIVALIGKIERQIEKLTSVTGLADPMLVALRKELAVCIKKRNWDEAQKIQNLITARVNELQPKQPQVVDQEDTSKGGDTTVVVQEPSEKHIKVEHVPRYGAEDVGRAISLLQGRSGSLTSKEAGALKMLDILMKR